MKAYAYAFIIAASLGIAASAYAQLLSVTGLDGKSVTLSSSDIAALGHVKVSVTQHGHDHQFEGVPLSAILQKVDAPGGEKLRGHDMTDVVLVTAHDGYKVALSLAETDPGMTKGQVILADKVDGAAIDPRDGPFRLVVASDLRPARAERMVDSIRLIRLGGGPKPSEAETKTISAPPPK